MTIDKLKELEGLAIDELAGLMETRQRQLLAVPGVLGKSNTQGSATVSTFPTQCWVRVGNAETLAKAYNTRTPHTNGLAVMVGYEPAQPTVFQVLSTRTAAYPLATGDPGRGHLAPHADQHMWGVTNGGEDCVWVRVRQIVDCLVYPTDPASMTVAIRSGIYQVGQVVYQYDGGTLDLTSNKPSSQMRWVLIAMNASGPYTVNGTQAATVALTDIPTATDAADWRLAAVLLRASTTSITDWPSTIMILDLRFTGSRGIGSFDSVQYGYVLQQVETGTGSLWNRLNKHLYSGL